MHFIKYGLFRVKFDEDEFSNQLFIRKHLIYSAVFKFFILNNLAIFQPNTDKPTTSS